MLPSPQLSVIVPLYNAGTFFPPFMASLLAQTFQKLEIILVDDGSTDGSGELADRYAAAHQHVRAIH